MTEGLSRPAKAGPVQSVVVRFVYVDEDHVMMTLFLSLQAPLHGLSAPVSLHGLSALVRRPTQVKLEHLFFVVPKSEDASATALASHYNIRSVIVLSLSYPFKIQNQLNRDRQDNSRFCFPHQSV